MNLLAGNGTRIHGHGQEILIPVKHHSGSVFSDLIIIVFIAGNSIAVCISQLVDLYIINGMKLYPEIS